MDTVSKKRNKENRCNSYGRTYNKCYSINGKDKPITFKNLKKICKALSCTPNDIISFENTFENEI